MKKFAPAMFAAAVLVSLLVSVAPGCGGGYGGGGNNGGGYPTPTPMHSK